MTDEPDATALDDAVRVASKRTADAQRHVVEVVAEGLLPPPPTLEDVVQRAEDTNLLARDANEPQTDPEPSR